MVVVTLQGLGYPIDDFTAYGRYSEPNEFIRRLHLHFDETKASPKLGDIMVFWLVGRSFPQHVAICAGDTMIHAYAADARVREEPWKVRRWSTRIHSVFELRKAA